MSTESARRLTPSRRAVLDRLLDYFLDLDEAKRTAELTRLADRCPRLHRWLKRLIEASLQPTGFLDRMGEQIASYSRDAIQSQQVELPSGTRLGAWRILETVGSGGMGRVYRGERADGTFEMTVAIKLIRLRTRSLDERLRLERQLLARLNHANIARLIDAGSTTDGLAYLVMEWIDGTDLSLARPSTLAVSLDLFGQILAAVAHAHQRLVVHGDLKPANIRLTSSGQVRLLDFGVARLISEELVDGDSPKALTPAFSAPEQLGGDSATTRSDVWALGAILYWMLSGELLESERQTEQLEALASRLPRGTDLAAIIARACAEDPEQRYPGPTDLAGDIEHYRRGYPVAARPWTGSYALARLVGRHRLGTSLTALALLGLIAAAAAIVTQTQIATRERDRAQIEAEHAVQISDFVINLFEQADPGNARGVNITARELLEQGMIQADALAEQPQVQARILTVLARVNFALGQWQKSFELAKGAEQALARTMDPAAPEVLRSRLIKARAQIQLRDFESAEVELRSILDQTPDAPGSLPHHQLKAETLLYLARALDAAGGRLDEVWPLIERGFDLTAEEPDLALVRASFMQLAGTASFHGGDYEKSLDYFQRAHAARSDLLGSDHPDTLDSADNLGQTLGELGRMDEAIIQQESVLEARRRVLDPTHPMISRTLHNIGSMHWLKRDTAQAGHWWRQALELRETAVPSEPTELATTRNALALVLTEEEQYDQAEELYRQAYEDLVAAYGTNNLRVPMVLANMAIVQARRGNWDRVIELHLEALAMRRAIAGDYHHHVSHSLRNLAGVHLNLGQPEQALEWIRQAEEVAETVFSDPDHPERQAVDALRQRIDRALADTKETP